MIKKNLLLLLLILPLSLVSKEVRVDFEDKNAFYEKYQFAKGISGSAIDLSAEAYYRGGIKVSEIDSVDMSKSFTVGIWLRSTTTKVGYKPLITNKKSLDPKDPGFVIATQENGSWMVAFTNGEYEQWDYKPTVERQPINDGKWHFLSITHNAEKDEMWMYYDGKNVAIYCTNGNRNLASNHPFWLGNLTEGEWNSFEGNLDEFFFVDKVLSPADISEEYIRLSGKKIKNNAKKKVKEFNMMGFNIFHGGHELGEEVGVNRTVEVIKAAKADLVGLIETYGSGAIIADKLEYYFYLRSSNLSIMSKYPIVETFDFYNSFNCSAATIQMSETQQINYVNLWLDYRPNTDLAIIREGHTVERILKDEWQTRAKELKTILTNMKPMLDSDVPCFVSGDFNIDSHLDWTEEAKHLHYGYVIEWPTSIMMDKAGFIDSYRERYPNPITHPCLTWSTMSKLDLQYRIDFIYYKSDRVKATASEMIDYHPVRYPSDHSAMVTTFNMNTKKK